MARRAKSLDVLLAQVNALYPSRSKKSDGWLGDKAHEKEKSDHNPDRHQIVKAQDITNDPEHGLVARDLAERLVASRDSRIKYIISNAEINSSYKAKDGTPAWKWRKYTGKNDHRKHVHISVVEDRMHADDQSPWDLTGKKVTIIPKVVKELKKGDKGDEVKALQLALRAVGYDILADGDFGANTDKAVRDFQKSKGLKADGIVGKATRQALGI